MHAVPQRQEEMLQFRWCSYQSSTSQPWLQKTRSDAPLLTTRALRAARRLVLEQKRWITSLTEPSGAGRPPCMAAFPGLRRKRRRSLMKTTEKRLQKLGQPRMGSTERLQRQVMLPLQVWSHLVASRFRWVRGLLLARQHFVSSSLVNVTFRKSNSSQHVLVAWSPGSCVTVILIPSPVLLLEYAALDDMATFWLFHYVRCYRLCDLAINDMVCNPALSNGVARDARRRDGSGTNTFVTCERH